IFKQRIARDLDLVIMNVRFRPGQANGLRIGDEMNLMAAASQLKTQFGGHNSATAVGRITGDANLHATPDATPKIPSLDSREGLGMQKGGRFVWGRAPSPVRAERSSAIAVVEGILGGCPILFVHFAKRMVMRSVLARLFRGQVAGLFDLIQIQPAGRELRDLPAASSSQFHLEDLGPDQAPHRAFVHGKEASTLPVPELEVVGVVDADLHSQLGLSPEAGAVGRSQPDSGIKVGKLELAVTA